mgnify:CR=1 FL=1
MNAMKPILVAFGKYASLSDLQLLNAPSTILNTSGKLEDDIKGKIIEVIELIKKDYK